MDGYCLTMGGSTDDDVDDGASTIGALSRFPISLTRICSGGAG